MSDHFLAPPAVGIQNNEQSTAGEASPAINMGSRRLLGLDGLRGVAVAMVLVTHAARSLPGGSYIGWLAPLRLISGDFGVHMFFVLSGFIITTILLSEYQKTGTIDLGNFYLRRTKRIFPAFYTYLVVVLVLSLAGYLSIRPSNLAFAALYLWNYVELFHIDTSGGGFPDGLWYLGHFWTLALEEQFYWFWPALFIFVMRTGKTRILTWLILAVPTVRIATYFAFPSVRGQLIAMLPTGIDSILVGCYFAIHRRQLEQTFSRILNSYRGLSVLVCTMFIGMPIAHYVFSGYWMATYMRTAEAGTIGILLLALANNNAFILRSLFLSRPALFLGKISFSLYLWQQLVTGIGPQLGLRYFDILEVSIALGAISYYVIEKRFLTRHAPITADVLPTAAPN